MPGDMAGGGGDLTGGGGDMTGGGGDLAGKPDGGNTMVNTGSLVLKGKTLQMNFITTDDNIGIFDAAGLVATVPVAGGPSTPISAAQGATTTVTGKVLTAYENFNNNTSVGDLTIWTKAHGVVVMSPNSVVLAVSSDDGEYLVHTNNANGDGSAADIVIAKTDGTGLKTLFTNQVMIAPCFPEVRFAAGNFFISHCNAAAGPPAMDLANVDQTLNDMVTPPSDMVVPPAAVGTLSMVTTAGVATTVKTGVQAGYSVSKDGTKLMVKAVNGDISIIGPTGTALSTAPEKLFLDGLFAPDGSFLFATTDRKLKRWTTLTAPATTLVSANFNQFLDISKDFSNVLFNTMMPTKDNAMDVLLASATAAGTPTTIVGTQTGAVFGNGFTTDGSHIIFYTNVKSGAGTIMTQPTTGGTPTQHGVVVWTSFAAGGSSVWYNDNFKSTGMGVGRADIRIVDSAVSPSAPRLIVNQAEESDASNPNGFLLTNDLKTVVYEWRVVVGKEGIYAAK